MLDIPEPANVKVIVSEFALMCLIAEDLYWTPLFKLIHSDATYFCKLLDHFHCKSNYLSLNVFPYSPLILRNTAH